MSVIGRNKEKIRRTLSIVTSVLLVAIGILFVISCYSIYKSGDSPFTRESISSSFSKIAIPVYVSLFFVLLGLCFAVAYPEDAEKLKGKRTDTLVMKTLYSKADLSSVSAALGEAIAREEKLRRILRYVNVALFILSGTLPFIYLLNPNNFPAASGEYNSEIMKGMLVYLACLMPVFVYEIFYVIVCSRSVKREIELLRQVMKNTATKNNTADEENKSFLSKISDFVNNNEKSLVLGVRIALIGCAVGFIVAGIINGGMNDVLKKAVKICTECIGLG